jgi:hypothetical protein
MKCLFVFSVLFASLLAWGQRKDNAPSLSETIEWLTGASEEESGWGSGHFQLSSHNCNVEILSTEILSTNAETPSPIKISRTKYSFRLMDIDPTDIRYADSGLVGRAFIEFHSRNYKENITVTKYKDAEAEWSDKVVLDTVRVRSVVGGLQTNSEFARRFVKPFKRAVELCGGKQSSY